MVEKKIFSCDFLVHVSIGHRNNKVSMEETELVPIWPNWFPFEKGILLG